MTILTSNYRFECSKRTVLHNHTTFTYLVLNTLVQCLEITTQKRKLRKTTIFPVPLNILFNCLKDSTTVKPLTTPAPKLTDIETLIFFSLTNFTPEENRSNLNN